MSCELIAFIIVLFGLVVAYCIGVEVGAETERRRFERELVVARIRSYTRSSASE